MKEQQLQTDSKVLTDLNIKNIEEIEIDLIAFVRKIITIRKMLYKAAVIGLVIGIIIALSIPNQYTVMVTLSPEMGNAKGNNGLAGLAASFLGNGATVGESSDALNASLSADIVSSTPFLLELFDVEIPVFRMNRKLTLKSYLDEQSLPWWNYIIAFPNIFINGIRSLFVKDEIDTGISHYIRNPVVQIRQNYSDPAGSGRLSPSSVYSSRWRRSVPLHSPAALLNICSTLAVCE